MPTFSAIATNVKNRQQQRQAKQRPILNWFIMEFKGILRKL